ncbi:hypothetical protein K3495_g7799 [Podosphaera aphanis]|nr:hypothetical protein K3495_g7799 [Podosphaera aphanis]
MTRITRAVARQISQSASSATHLKRSNSSQDVGRKSKRIKREHKLDASEVHLSPPPSPRKLTAESSAKDLQSKKLSSFTKFQNVTPFPGFVHPTAAECKQAHRILSELHGARNRPKETIAPSSRSGCGDSPSVLDALVRTILSQNTSDTNSTRAKLSMDQIYGRSDKWKAIHAGGQAKLQGAIKCGGLSAIKSRVILNILDQVLEKYDTYSLDHLHSATSEEAMKEMLSFKGVGFKTASCVLLFCLQRESFAVDTHVWRITGLLGWRPDSANRDETFRHLDVRIPNEDKYGLHILLVTHGKKCEECKAGGKAIGKCELRKAFSQKKHKKETGSSDTIKQEVDEVEAKSVANSEIKRELKNELKKEEASVVQTQEAMDDIKDEANGVKNEAEKSLKIGVKAEENEGVTSAGH